MVSTESPARRPPESWLRHLERGAVALLLAAALVPRLPDLRGPFDRGFEGFQGSFFATCAVNYERLGLGALNGYPVANVDLSADDPQSWYAYANHPPAVPLLAWAGAAALGPSGWDEAWKEDRAPEGLETALRLPFFALHLLLLYGLYRALRPGAGAQTALIALALLAVLPLAVLYAGLVNYENPSLALVVLGYAAAARWLASEGRARRRALLAYAACFALAGCVTFAPVFFVAALAGARLLRGRPREAAVLGGAGLGAALLPLAVHGLVAGRTLAGLGQPADTLPERARRMLAPLLDGSVPLPRWLGIQAGGLVELFTIPVLLAAAVGLGFALRECRRRDSLALPLFAGGALLHLAFYRHTSDVPRQDVFFLNLAPGIAALAAVAVDRAGRPLLRLRAGLAPLVVLVSSVGLPALVRAGELRALWRGPGPADDPALADGPELPLPPRAGAALAEALPSGAAGLYPQALGFGNATFYYAWRTLQPLSLIHI